MAVPQKNLRGGMPSGPARVDDRLPCHVAVAGRIKPHKPHPLESIVHPGEHNEYGD